MGWLLRIASFLAGLAAVATIAGVVMQGPALVRSMLKALTGTTLNWPIGLFFFATALILLAALPLAIADGLATKRFRDAEQRLRKLRPEAAVTPYAGPEGDGLKFETTTNVTLLLRPAGGLGATRMLETSAPPPDVNYPAAS